MYVAHFSFRRRSCFWVCEGIVKKVFSACIIHVRANNLPKSAPAQRPCSTFHTHQHTTNARTSTVTDGRSFRGWELSQEGQHSGTNRNCRAIDSSNQTNCSGIRTGCSSLVGLPWEERNSRDYSHIHLNNTATIRTKRRMNPLHFYSMD